jgi:predicted nucleotidyltransferase/HEPN domain-containing protein
MKTTLDQLPQQIQVELAEITEIIKKGSRPEMIILFGSYARGDWIEDRYVREQITYEYKSDLDILVIVKKNGTTFFKTWNRIEETIRSNDSISSDVNIIAHGIDEVNKKLSEGHYFFSDIIREGILLYDSGKCILVGAGELSPAERKEIAERDFHYWFESAEEFYLDFKHALARNSPMSLKKAAFELHQATEHFLVAAILTFTQYKPKTHDIEKLEKLLAPYNIQAGEVFLRQTEFEIRCYKLLKRAYVDARYDMNYTIGKEELKYLEGCVIRLREMICDACKRKINSFILS